MKNELKDRWSLQVKLSTLSSLVEKQKVQEEKVKDRKTIKMLQKLLLN
jgi:carboxyl-terminal processing protease